MTQVITSTVNVNVNEKDIVELLVNEKIDIIKSEIKDLEKEKNKIKNSLNRQKLEKDIYQEIINSKKFKQWNKQVNNIFIQRADLRDMGEVSIKIENKKLEIIFYISYITSSNVKNEENDLLKIISSYGHLDLKLNVDLLFLNKITKERLKSFYEIIKIENKIEELKDIIEQLKQYEFQVKSQITRIKLSQTKEGSEILDKIDSMINQRVSELITLKA